MKTMFKLMLALLLCCAGLTAQPDPQPIPIDQVETVADAQSDVIVEDIILHVTPNQGLTLYEEGEAAPGLLASKDHASDIEVRLEPDPGPLASNYQASDPDADADDPGTDEPPVDDPDEPFNFPEWLRNVIAGFIPETLVGWISTVLIAVGAIVRITPTEKDDEYYMWAVRLVNWLIPNKRKGGGKHPV